VEENDMSIIHKLLDDGGFVVGDTETCWTAYAYPTSHFAETARKSPEKVAVEMLREQGEAWINIRDYYDKRNWELLGGKP
jgi:hypothetical protein